MNDVRLVAFSLIVDLPIMVAIGLLADVANACPATVTCDRLALIAEFYPEIGYRSLFNALLDAGYIDRDGHIKETPAGWPGETRSKPMNTS